MTLRTAHASNSRLWGDARTCCLVAVLVGLLLFVSGSFVEVAAKGIHATVEASWNETSLFQEGCEWATRRNTDRVFYRCLEALWHQTPSDDEGDLNGAGDVFSGRFRTQQQQYTSLRRVLAGLPEMRGADWVLFEMEMAARVYSPAVEAHYALAVAALQQTTPAAASIEAEGAMSEDCAEAFAVVYTRSTVDGPLQMQRVRSASALESAVVQPHTATVTIDEVAFEQFDHRYVGSNSSSFREAASVVVVYGIAGSSAAYALHRTAVDLISTMDAASAPLYFWRHLPVSEARLCEAVGAPFRFAGAGTSHTWDTPLALQGYGVTVDIKNMEYKVLDEKAAGQQRAKGQASAEGGTSSEVMDAADAAAVRVPDALANRIVGGFHVARLKERYPHLAASLEDFASQLDEDLGGDEMKVDFHVWELQGMGVAVAQYISEVDNASRRLDVLKEVVTRFPAYAAALSRISSQPSRLEKMQSTLTTLHGRLSPGFSALFVDGWRVEEKELSLFGVLRALHEEEKLSNRIKTVLTTRTVSPEAAGELPTVKTVLVHPALLEKYTEKVKQECQPAATAISGSATSQSAFAIAEEDVIWLNNVETDANLEGLSTKLSSFFVKGFGATPFPRRNVINFVFLMQPTSKACLHVLSIITRFRQQGIIARFGLALVDPTWSPLITAREESLSMGRGGYQDDNHRGGLPLRSPAVLQISAILQRLVVEAENERGGGGGGGSDAVMFFLLRLFQTATGATSNTIPDEVVADECEKIAKVHLGTTLAKLTTDVEFLEKYHATQAALHRFSVPAYPAVFLNGIFLSEGIASLAEALPAEVLQLRQWVSGGALRDDVKSLYASILELRGAIDHLQPALMAAPTIMSWADEASIVSFIESLPYIPSASYADELPSLTMLVVLPYRPTLTSLQLLQTVVTALAECGEAAQRSRERNKEVCGQVRLTVVSCSPWVSPVQLHISALLRWLTGSRLAESEHHVALSRYIAHMVAAVASVNSNASAPLDAKVIADALVAAPLPDEVQDMLQGRGDGDLRTGHADFCARLEDVSPWRTNGVALIVNGRVFPMDETFTVADVLEAARLVVPITREIQEAVLNVDFAGMSSPSDGGFEADELGTNFFASKIACLSSLFSGERVRRTSELGPTSGAKVIREEDVVASPADWRRLSALTFTVNNTQDESAPTSPVVEGPVEATDTAAPLHFVTAVVDPSSRSAQVIVSLAYYLVRSPLRVRLRVLLNPVTELKFPIRNFFEYVASPKVVFEEAVGRMVAPTATFTSLPTTALLTLGVDEPPSWTVFSQEAEVDLDNILLSKLSRGAPFVTAVYRMHSVLVTGDTTDVETGVAPDGLPLSLEPSPSRMDGVDDFSPAHPTPRTDTQVMANQKGYYQLSANPGPWYLSVKEGPVAPAYCIEAIDGRTVRRCAAGGVVAQGVNWTKGQHLPLIIDSFRGRFMSLRVRHTPLAEGESEAARTDLHTILQRMAADVQRAWPPTQSMRGPKPTPPPTPTLNIFSVASGHLYERFLRMMMYSVHKTSSDQYGANTTRIKFWIIENFLSPNFKRYIPRLANSLGFEVGFVTYRWPWWLPQQTEKQRKIWAYKILFLDVLFPLDVDRIIFVDADQTAQADLHELYNMDIEGLPVAMTPFCQKYKNEATVAFRFWEKGYWVDHLHGKPYHISAIFLVDLRRFRAMLAGDRYRSTYAQLAGDPNSLSNLDQDLPNYLQSLIPIYSLPEQWLWCETWCSNQSKSRAKTIDLCNNPLTKIPKLENAKAIIPGWEELDNALQNLSERVVAES